VKPNLMSTMISFLFPALGRLEAGTGLRILDILMLLTILSTNSIPIPRIVVFAIVFKLVVFSGEQLT
jgi:hypothetical protein